MLLWKKIVLNKIFFYCKDNLKLNNKKVIEERKKDFKFKIIKIKKEIKNFETKIDEVKELDKKMYIDKLKGIIPEQKYINLSIEFEKQINELILLIRKSHEELKNLENDSVFLENRKNILEKYKNIKILTLEAVDDLIEKILIGKREKGEKEPPVEIVWKF